MGSMTGHIDAIAMKTAESLAPSELTRLPSDRSVSLASSFGSSPQSCQSSNLSFASPQPCLASPNPSVASLAEESLGTESDSAIGEAAFGSVFGAVGGLDNSITSTASAADAADTESPEDQKCPMVCHHWKSKGWCRMGAECKFLHPDHKRGVGSKPRRGRRGRCSDSSASGSGSSSCISSPQQVERTPQLGSDGHSSSAG